MRDVLMFVWVKFCCPTSIVKIRVPGFQSDNRAEKGGHMFLFWNRRILFHNSRYISDCIVLHKYLEH
jgi:hypothetical protein